MECVLSTYNLLFTYRGSSLCTVSQDLGVDNDKCLDFVGGALARRLIRSFR
jgi:hypothetical protein